MTAPAVATGAGMLQTALSLLLVLAAIFALAWLLRRVQGFRPASSAALSVRGGLQVGPKERVLWLRAGNQDLLIGVAAGRVQTLHVFDQSPDETVLPPLQSATPPSFADALRKVMRGNKPQ